MKGTQVASQWIAWNPTHRMDAKYWIKVQALCDERGIDECDKRHVIEVMVEVANDDHVCDDGPCYHEVHKL